MIKRIIKETFAFILIQMFSFNRPRNKILSIYFHNPTKKVFENVLQWLAANNYKIISIKKLQFIIDQKHKPSENMVSITFDDGWNKNLELMELIEEYKAPVTIFVPTEAVIDGNYWFEFAKIEGQAKYTCIPKKENFKKLEGNIFKEKVSILKSKYFLNRSCFTLEELRKIGENKFITIGSHSVTHPILNKLTQEKQEEELINSRKILSKWLNREIEYLAYPNGDYNDTTIEIAKRSGYKLGFSTIIGMIDVQKVNPYAIPRNAINDEGGYYENISKILGIWQKFYYKNTFFFKLFNK